MSLSQNYKVIVVGESSTGKTTIIQRLVQGTFREEAQSTVGVEFKSFVCTVDGKQRKLQIWDTAGQERFRSVAKSYFRNAVGAALVFSLTDKKSFEALDGWLNDLQSLCVHNAVILLIGNKLDLAEGRVVSGEDANVFAERHGLEYFETSALDATNVDEAFVRLAKSVYEKVEKGELQSGFQAAAPPVVLNEAPHQQQSGGSCC